MLIVRLQRVGRTNDPNFRLVVIESRRAAQSGSFVEIVGAYSPRGRKFIQLHDDRIRYWLSKGAKTSSTVHNLLVKHKVIEGKKISVVPLPKKKEEVVSVEAPAMA